MPSRYLSRFSLSLTAFVFSSLALAGGTHIAGNVTSQVDGHAPIGVMGDHLHEKGEWMISYRYMRMFMEDNLQGSSSISPDTIVTTVPNRFSDNPMQPPTLRVVPLEMTTEMHMLGAMYAPSDKLTVMLMVNYIEKTMDHVTYMGGAGTNVRGLFTTETSGFGDTKLAALWRLYNNDSHRLHLNIGVSLPTGSTDEEDQILAPTGMMPTLRLPYPMQLGSGSFDFEPGITYTGNHKKWGWGSQLKAAIRLETNDEGYQLGDQAMLSGWGSYRFADWISGSVRLTYSDIDKIDGIDPNIVAPVQTADPNNYGGERLDLGFGLNFLASHGHRVALEYETTIDQDANGVQLEMQDMLTLGYQYSL